MLLPFYLIHIMLLQVTSIPLEVHARLQISIRSEPVPGIK